MKTNGSSADILTLIQANPDYMADASASLREINQACVDHMKAGELTLKFKLTPKSTPNGPVITITPANPGVKKPETGWAGKTMFYQPGGLLTEDIPGQANFLPQLDDDKAQAPTPANTDPVLD